MALLPLPLQDLLHTKFVRKIVKKGVNIQFLTLHVGLNTFASVKIQNIEDHKTHTKKFSLNKAACDAVNHTKQPDNKVVCVSITTMQVLESFAINNKVAPQI